MLMRVISTALARCATIPGSEARTVLSDESFGCSDEPVHIANQRQSTATVKDHPGGVDYASFPSTC